MNEILRTAVRGGRHLRSRGASLRWACAALLVIAAPCFVAAQENATGSPLEEVARDMKVASNHLSKRATDKPTQTAQTDALSKLDRLIAELEKEREQVRQGMASARPMRPADQSQVRQGPGGDGDMRGPREKGGRWGELPAHERDRILQSMDQGFPPHYQSILEAYYKRLAVEKPFDPSAAPAAAGAKKPEASKTPESAPAEKAQK